jgi:CHAT domain-containing protein
MLRAPRGGGSCSGLAAHVKRPVIAGEREHRSLGMQEGTYHGARQYRLRVEAPTNSSFARSVLAMFDRWKRRTNAALAYTRVLSRRADATVGDGRPVSVLSTELRAFGRMLNLLTPESAVVEYLPVHNGVLCSVFGRGFAATATIPFTTTELASLDLKASLLEAPKLGVEELEEAAVRLLSDDDTNARLLHPIMGAIEGRGTTKLTVIARGPLARVPFHALDLGRSLKTNRPLRVSYLPSLPSATATETLRDERDTVTVLAAPQDNLPIARGLSPYFRRRGIDVITGEAFTRQALSVALQERGELVICCHGDKDGLQLADGILTSEWLDEHLPGSHRKTVALMACRAGHAGTAEVGLASGLPALLLRKGVKWVVASYWQIPELSAMLFADAWTRALVEGLPGPEAYERAARYVQSAAFDAVASWRSECLLAARSAQDRCAALWFAAATAMELATSSLNAHLEYPARRAAREMLRPLRSQTRDWDDCRWHIPAEAILAEVDSWLDWEREAGSSNPSSFEHREELEHPVFAAPIHWALLFLFGLNR